MRKNRKKYRNDLSTNFSMRLNIKIKKKTLFNYDEALVKSQFISALKIFKKYFGLRIIYLENGSDFLKMSVNSE